MDVDGTLTNGKIYFNSNGEAFKAFDVKDGYAITHFLKKASIEPLIITGRSSNIVAKRCEDLGIHKIYQGEIDKMSALLDAIDSDELGTCAYIGDDVADLKCMRFIKNAGGLIGCPANAVSEVKDICDFISDKDGGDGAVREFIEWIISGLMAT